MLTGVASWNADQTEKRRLDWKGRLSSPGFITSESSGEIGTCVDEENSPNYDQSVTTNQAIEHVTHDAELKHSFPERAESPNKIQERAHNMHQETNIKYPSPKLHASPTLQSPTLQSTRKSSRTFKSTDVHITAKQRPVNQSPGICDERIDVCDLLHPQDVASDTASSCSDNKYEDHGKSPISLEKMTTSLKDNDCNGVTEISLLQSSASFQQPIPKSHLGISTTRSVADIIDEANDDTIPGDDADASISPVGSSRIVHDEHDLEVENAEFNNNDGGENTAQTSLTKDTVTFLFGHENENIEAVVSNDESEEAIVSQNTAKLLLAIPAVPLRHNEVNENRRASVSDDGSDDSIDAHEATQPLPPQETIDFDSSELEHGNDNSEANTRDDGSDDHGVPKTAEIVSSPMHAPIPDQYESAHEIADHTSDITHEISREITADVIQTSQELNRGIIGMCSLQAIKVQSCLRLGTNIQNVDQWATEFSIFPRDDDPICQLQFLLKWR